MIRKLLALSVAVVVLFLFSGCGEKDYKSTRTDDPKNNTSSKQTASVQDDQKENVIQTPILPFKQENIH